MKSLYARARLWALVLLALIVATLFVFSCSCQRMPNREDYKADIEFVLADCLYRSQGNPVVCDKLAERYRDWHKEQAFEHRLEYCSGKLPPGWTRENCLYYLNQK